MIKPRIDQQTSERGLTLIEMLVVTGIITIITGLVLTNNNRFGGQVLLQNLAYDIALSIREAQIYGISVQQFQGVFGYAYGMHFQRGNDSSSTYVLFADVEENGVYDCDPGDMCELVESANISQGFYIADICANPPSSQEVCGLTALDITFKRPEPDAYIRTPDYIGPHESARIVVKSPRNEEKSITVGANGQISVQ